VPWKIRKQLAQSSAKINALSIRAHADAGIGPVFASVTARAFLRWLLIQEYQSDAELVDNPPGWLIDHRELFDCCVPGNVLHAIQTRLEHSQLRPLSRLAHRKIPTILIRPLVSLLAESTATSDFG